MLYVVDYNNHRVQKFTLTGEYLGQFGSPGSNDGQFNGPYGICTDGRGRVLVADYGNNRVQIFNGDGTFVSSISASNPYDVAIDNTGNIHEHCAHPTMLQYSPLMVKGSLPICHQITPSHPLV